MSAPEGLPVYVLRLAEDARRQIDAEIIRLFDAVGEDAAVAWRDGMEEAVSILATLPGRCPIAPENSLYQRVHPGGTLRQLLYPRRRSGPAWRLLFTIQEETVTDPPTVRILQVRHAAQSPLAEWPPGTDQN